MKEKTKEEDKHEIEEMKEKNIKMLFVTVEEDNIDKATARKPFKVKCEIV